MPVSADADRSDVKMKYLGLNIVNMERCCTVIAKLTCVLGLQEVEEECMQNLAKHLSEGVGTMHGSF